jgi:hypothetical protein
VRHDCVHLLNATNQTGFERVFDILLILLSPLQKMLHSGNGMLTRTKTKECQHMTISA